MAVYKMHSFVVLFVVVSALFALSEVQGFHMPKINLMRLGRNNMRNTAAIYNADKDVSQHIIIDDDDEDLYPTPVILSPKQKIARRRSWSRIRW